MSDIDLEGVIEDSVNDAVSADPEPSVDTSAADTTDVAADTPTDDASTDASSSQVTAPGAQAQDDTVADEFAKRFGLQSQSITGRENRIPYSRVKKITEKAEKDAYDRAKKEFDTGGAPKLVEYETKIKDYEGRLQKVAEFEQLIEHRPQEFMNFLSTLPAYKDFFAYINQLAAQTAQPQGQQVQQQSYLDTSSMPQPDETLSDGSKVYSLAGLAKRDEWLARQIEAKALAAAEARIGQRYAPMQEQFEAEQRRQAAIPVIQKQIAEARQWPHFTDHEADIIEVLKANPNLSLDGAYRQVITTKVLPKLQETRDAQRASILEELKKKPTATAAPSTPVRPGTPTPSGPRSLEDVIAEAVKGLK